MSIELTSLSVTIDPTGAEQGAARAIRASQNMASSVRGGLESVGRQNRAAAQDARRSGQEMAGAANSVDAALDNLGDNNAAQAAARSFARGANGMAGAARTAGAGMGAMANTMIDVMSGLGLLNGRMGRFIQQGQGLARSAGALTGGIGGLGGAFRGAAAGAAALWAALLPVLPIILAVSAALAALFIGFKTAQAGVNFIKSGIPVAAATQTAKTGLAVLMGSFDLAEKRIKEVRQLAANTPFEAPDLLEASRVMQIFTDGALAGTKGLTLLGDVAAGVGKPISEVSVWVGRLYAGLQGGAPIGEATARLLELGAITPQTKSRLEELNQTTNKGGANFKAIWGEAEASLQRFTGTMALQSGTWNGLMSTIRDNWNLVKENMAAPVMDALTPLLPVIIAALQKLQPAAAAIGEMIATAIKVTAGLVMNLERIPQLLQALGADMFSAIYQGIAGVGIRMMDTFQTALTWLVTNLVTALTDPIGTFETHIQPVIETLGTAFLSIGSAFKDALFEAVRSSVDWLLRQGTTIKNFLSNPMGGWSAAKPTQGGGAGSGSVSDQGLAALMTRIRVGFDLIRDKIGGGSSGSGGTNNQALGANTRAIFSEILRDWDQSVGKPQIKAANEVKTGMIEAAEASEEAAMASQDVAGAMIRAAHSAGDIGRNLAAAASRPLGGSSSITWEAVQQAMQEGKGGHTAQGDQTYFQLSYSEGYKAWLAGQQQQQSFGDYSGSTGTTGTTTIRDNVRTEQTNPNVTIINVTSQEEILAALAANPQAIINIINNNS